ncbi:GLPGLI family protein [Confluentibacter citreus]|uniref:GLPGLI family protein n=1 Tax=Confluentibacter citreus TaxID=2007307 RepID=UPI000C28AF29|nr:GLPGLI family protein [Confluentibacter citreus]
MKTILFLFFATLFVNAQNDSILVYKIEYERKITPENFTKSLTASLELKTYPDLNISVFDISDSAENSASGGVKNDPDDDQSLIYTPKGENLRCVFKDYNNNQMFNKQDIAFKYFTIKDSLTIFNWQIKEDTKEILGYKCQLAVMTFRDRNYSAWFSPDLPIGGPWKYDGLPGMILSIKSDKAFIEFEAIGIISRKIEATAIKNPFEKDKTVSWSEFKNLYKKKAIELSMYSPEKEDDGGIILTRKGIERYIEENDTDFTADKEFEKQLLQNKN